YVARMDYVAAVSNGLGYCLAVEKVLNVEDPPRAQTVRVVLTEVNRSGTQLYETYDGFEKYIHDFCTMFLPKVDEYEELLTNNRIWVSRLKGVGILNAEECKDYGVTGPVLRAAGVKWDLRKAQPYSGYEQYDFDIT